MSLRLKMVVSFLAFAAAVLLLLWLFQTVLLDDIYRALKMRDLERGSDTLAEYALDMVDEDFESVEKIADEIAKNDNVCISICKITDSRFGRRGVVLCDKHVNSLCFVHNIRSEQFLSDLYYKTAENGGEYVEEILLSEMFGGGEILEAESGANVIKAKLVDCGDFEYLMLFNTELVPLNSTVDTLRVQLIYISIILIVVALALAFIFSSRISKPIREMSKEASKLALGDYSVNFDGGNCSETMTLSATLNRAAYELSRLDRMQKDLIANVSHDLRTPLTMIAGYTEAMRDLPGEATPENMQIVIDETNRLTSLVNDMLEVSRYQNGEQILKLSEFNFTNVIRVTLERYAKLKERDGYSITFDADRDVAVYADEGRILQVIYNLINNAVNYAGEDKSVLIRQLVADDGSVTLEVIDNGIGIPAEDLPLVWERYYKVNDFHKRANMGTGLGLSIVKNILLLHGAQFGVRSRVGQGSCFWFTLPIAEAENNITE
ncbi:MAG: HAMP domain-containing protein [Ruminococcaceae bacterium]|nr:HAMP domain-containing protein [Oscillospiraceae bacterium]